VFDDSGHFLTAEEPARFLGTVERFLGQGGAH
jgi:hypothetical protein